MGTFLRCYIGDSTGTEIAGKGLGCREVGMECTVGSVLVCLPPATDNIYGLPVLGLMHFSLRSVMRLHACFHVHVNWRTETPG